MQSKVLTRGDERTFIVIVEPGEEAFHAIKTFARDNHINAASVTAIGAFETATLAFFDLKSQISVPGFGFSLFLSTRKAFSRISFLYVLTKK